MLRASQTISSRISSSGVARHRRILSSAILPSSSRAHRECAGATSAPKRTRAKGALGLLATGSTGLSQQDATVLRVLVRCAGFLVPSSPPLVPLVVAEPPSYYSRLSSYTQTLSADTLVYLALRVTGRFICVKTYQFAEINGNIRLPASAPCYARSTVLLPSKPPALLLRLSILQAGRPRVPRAHPPPLPRCPLEEQVTSLAAWDPLALGLSLPVGCSSALSLAESRPCDATGAITHRTTPTDVLSWCKTDHQRQSNPPTSSRPRPHTLCLLPSPSAPFEPRLSF